MKDKTNQDYITILQAAGLTQRQAAIYWHLNIHSGKSAYELAQALQTNKSNVYRALKQLTEKGFIIKYDINQPSFYMPRPISEALAHHNEYLRTKLMSIILLQRQQQIDRQNY